MPEAKGRPYHRRQWIVNPSIQFPFVKAMLIVLGIMTMAALVAVQVAIHITLTTFQLSHDPVVVPLFQTAFWVIMLEMLVLVPVVVWLGIVLTHKVAGPLVRIHAALAQLSKGALNAPIKLRKGDLLSELAEAINRLAESQGKLKR